MDSVTSLASRRSQRAMIAFSRALRASSETGFSGKYCKIRSVAVTPRGPCGGQLTAMHRNGGGQVANSASVQASVVVSGDFCGLRDGCRFGHDAAHQWIGREWRGQNLWAIDDQRKHCERASRRFGLCRYAVNAQRPSNGIRLASREFNSQRSGGRHRRHGDRFGPQWTSFGHKPQREGCSSQH